MKKWNSSPHPISDIRDWQRTGRLEIRPAFQRHEVWSDAARIMLMDTILRAIPMPKAFVSSAIREGQVYRTVIDGQQRISSILAFLDDKFSLEIPYGGEYKGLAFSQLPEEVRNEFLQYSIDFNEAIGFSDDELRETYSRLNKYAVALTKQELRRADYPGAFLELAESLAAHDFLDAGKVFSVANRRRFADVEFVSELLAGLIAGPQEKRESLDFYYLKYTDWEKSEIEKIEARFLACLSDLAILFPPERPISSTRFKQKSDFYSLLLAIDELRAEGGSLEGRGVEELRMDLRMLDFLIEPESAAPDCRDYAIKCVSQANTHGSRRWRMDFLKAILGGTYFRLPPTGDGATLFYRLVMGNHGPFGEPTVNLCGVCNDEVSRDDALEIGWKKGSQIFQVHNAIRLHAGCMNPDEWHVITSPNSEASLTFTRAQAQQPLI
jgi:hypothetical protein